MQDAPLATANIDVPAQEFEPALPMRSHTILGVCEAIGEDFGFNPTLLRVPLAAVVLFSPTLAIGGYFALGILILASRLIFPAPRRLAVRHAETVAPQSRPAERGGDQPELPLAA
jgi:phage shock protein C